MKWKGLIVIKNMEFGWTVLQKQNNQYMLVSFVKRCHCSPVSWISFEQVNPQHQTLRLNALERLIATA